MGDRLIAQLGRLSPTRDLIALRTSEKVQSFDRIGSSDTFSFICRSGQACLEPAWSSPVE